MHPKRAVGFALLLSFALAGGVRAQCEENPDGYDYWGEPEVLCKTCGSVTCAECWEFTGRKDDGSCVHCNVKGKFGGYCSKCDGEQPNFCLDCMGDMEGDLDFGLFATSEGRCEKCPLDNCLICENLTGNCTMCQVGMGLVNGKCEACSDDECITCEGSSDTCIECYSGFFPHPKTGRCAKCMDDCEECDNAHTCKECSRNGFSWSVEEQKCVPCESEGCNYCDGKNPGLCLSCDQGYDLRDGKCLKCEVEWCSVCDESVSTCRICQGPDYRHGPDWSSGRTKCVPCEIANCASCQQDSADCDWCEDGFAWDKKAKACVACTMDGCESCDVDGSCSGCMDGFEFDDWESPSRKCIKLQ